MYWSDQHIEPDSEKIESLIESIKKNDDLYELIHQLLPDWIIHTCDGYTSEYSILESNWKNLCNEWKTTPQKILIVSHVPSREEFEKLQSPTSKAGRRSEDAIVDVSDSSFRILATCCNRLTGNGFVVRAESELVACKKCKQAMISRRVYDYLQQHKSPLASGEWNECCKACQSTLF